ncbi:MAG: DUF2851 family protein [Opitutaceae bacterium]
MKPHADRASAPPRDRVEEFQGLYGPYQVSERLIQRIWLRGELDLARLHTVSGKTIRVIRPGEWNLLGGPDFLGADLEIDGRRMTGDVEIHFREADWFTHGHQHDPAYEKVILHLVLFPGGSGRHPALTRRGREIEMAVLVDLLWHDLEEYAANDAVARISGLSDDRALELLLELEPEERRARLRQLARERWNLKVHFAGIRIKRLGWSRACHASAMEILGYSRNRSAMLMTADRYPVETWGEREADPDEILGRSDIPWQFQGVRPANQPRIRLNQYAVMASGAGSWIERLDEWPGSLAALMPGSVDGSVGELRRTLDLFHLRRRLKTVVMNRAVSGPRADSMAVDGFLPLLATRGNSDLFALWFAWPAGDVPERWRSTLKQAGVAGKDRSTPFTQGWFQGLIGLLLGLPIEG